MLIDELAGAFARQQRFADGYSPLYAHLFGVVGDWLAADKGDEVVAWLVELAAARRPFDLTLLLPAALHREVLAGMPEAAPLAAFYPTAGGRVPDTPAPLAEALYRVILARRETLTAFIRRANVQTNETGRGLAAARGRAGLAGRPSGGAGGQRRAEPRRRAARLPAGGGR
jgi:hypothetical protein